MLHALRHRRFNCITWLVLLLALMQPALGQATHLHALHRVAHAHGQLMQAAPLATADADSGTCDTAAFDETHGRHGTEATDASAANGANATSPHPRNGHHDAAAAVASKASVFASANDIPHGDCDCRHCPVLASHVLACGHGPWLPAVVAMASPDAFTATPPRVYRVHPCGLGSRGPPSAAA